MTRKMIHEAIAVGVSEHEHRAWPLGPGWIPEMLHTFVLSHLGVTPRLSHPGLEGFNEIKAQNGVYCVMYRM